MKHVIVILAISLFALSSFQTLGETPGEHMQQLSDREETLSVNYMNYMSEVAHGRRARKMDKRRQELIGSIRQAIGDAGRIKPYKGDASLRDAYKKYWTVLLSVFTEDYEKIVDMEEVAERSYDAMEAYLLIQEKAGETVDAAYQDVGIAYRAFAAKHGVTLVEAQQNKLTNKLNKAGKVNQYLNQVFLIFFKSYAQEMNALEGLNGGDINAIEQSKNSMIKYATEGLTRLDTVKTFNGDGSIKEACRKVLEFHKTEAEKFSSLTDYMIKKDEFAKTKKAFEAIPASRRTQADVDKYNKSINEINSMITANNKLNDDLNKSRDKVLNNWDATKKKFMDEHVPHK